MITTTPALRPADMTWVHVDVMRCQLSREIAAEIRFTGTGGPTPEHIAILIEYLGVMSAALAPESASQRPSQEAPDLGGVA